MTYHTDCFVYGGNPSPKGGGFTITDEMGNLLWQVEKLKPGFTNNEGELLGVLHAAMLASHGDTIVTDSQNTIAWTRSGKPKARPDLIFPAALAKDLIRLKSLSLVWKPREQNAAGVYNEKHGAQKMLL
jgi:ribonuclease HI